MNLRPLSDRLIILIFSVWQAAKSEDLNQIIYGLISIKVRLINLIGALDISVAITLIMTKHEWDAAIIVIGVFAISSR
jgi:hypothetical protein